MATTFKKQFIANGLVAHVIKRKSGKNTFCYEIRYRSNGFCISAAANDLNKAKAKFLQKPFRGKSKNTVPKEKSKLRIISGRFYEKTNGLSNFPYADKKIVNRATISFPKFFPKRCRSRKNECIIIHLYNIKLAFMQ